MLHWNKTFQSQHIGITNYINKIRSRRRCYCSRISNISLIDNHGYSCNTNNAHSIHCISEAIIFCPVDCLLIIRTGWHLCTSIESSVWTSAVTIIVGRSTLVAWACPINCETQKLTSPIVGSNVLSYIKGFVIDRRERKGRCAPFNI